MQLVQSMQGNAVQQKRSLPPTPQNILPSTESSFFDVLFHATCQILTLPWVTSYLRILLDYYAKYKTKGAKEAEISYQIKWLLVEHRGQVVWNPGQSPYLTSAG